MIKFGTLGTAAITPQALLYPCINEPQAVVNSVAARDQARAQNFAEHHHIRNVRTDYAALVADQSCNAIYNPLPISGHYEWTLAALAEGKHVLCEKSLASNAIEAKAMADAAAAAGLILMDAFHYRYHPLFQKAKEIYQSGQLGEIRSIRGAFSIPNCPPDDDIRMNYATAGGVTMDIGCYPISWLRHLTDQEPEVISANAITGPENVDLMLEAEMRFPTGAEGYIRGDMRPGGKFTAELTVLGDDGTMTVKNPLAPHLGHLIQLDVGGTQSNFTVDRRTTYCYQLDAFISAIQTDNPPITDGFDAVKQMQIIDRCYELANLPVRGT